MFFFDSFVCSLSKLSTAQAKICFFISEIPPQNDDDIILMLMIIVISTLVLFAILLAWTTDDQAGDTLSTTPKVFTCCSFNLVMISKFLVMTMIITMMIATSHQHITFVSI